MTCTKPSFRLSLLATAVAMTLAAPAAMAAGATQLETREAPRAAANAAPGARLIVTYRDATAPNALKVRTVETAAARSRSLTAASARTGSKAPSATLLRRLAVGADLIRMDRKLSVTELNTLVRELKADPAVAAVEIDEMLQHTGGVRITTDVSPQLVPNDQ
ncbi:MAG: hypothetical protein ABIO84_08390 [Lysobacter sp.]